MTVQVTTYKFTVDEYDRMIDAGILGEDDRVELIEGDIVEMAPIGNRHIGVVNSLVTLFATPVLERAAVLSVQNPVIVGMRSEPEPDLVLLRFREDVYRESKPQAADVLLLVEVAETSAEYDRQTKLPLYARAGISEVWLIDLRRALVEVYREPVEGGFNLRTALHREDTLSPLSFPQIRARVEDITG